MNKEDFVVGTVFIGNETKQKMKIIKIEERKRESNGGIKVLNKVAVIENLKTKIKFCCGLDVLVNGNITILSA